jgi:hypothetical protein
MTAEASTPERSSSNALHYRPFVFYLLAAGAAGFAVQIMSVAVGWQVYDITRDPLDLGLIRRSFSYW